MSLRSNLNFCHSYLWLINHSSLNLYHASVLCLFLSHWYISSGVANFMCLHSELSGWLRAAGNYKRMQWWQMEGECADQDKTKAETEGRKRRRKKKTSTEIRFTLAAGLRDDFPYQQARGSGQIWFSPQLANTKQRERGGGRWQERWNEGKRERKGKRWVNGKRKGRGGDLRGRKMTVGRNATRNAKYLHHWTH